MTGEERFVTTLAAAKVGAEWAFAELYGQFQPRLLRYLRARAPGDAEDLASSTWLEIARAIGGFEGGEDQFAGFLFTVARRRLADERRRRGRRPVELVADVPDQTGSEGLDDRVVGDDAARRIVAALPDDLAEIVLLRVVAGLPVDEVAAIVGKRPGAVRVAQHRALKRLAKIVEDPR